MSRAFYKTLKKARFSLNFLENLKAKGFFLMQMHLLAFLCESEGLLYKLALI